jgi:hypothetical protein
MILKILKIKIQKIIITILLITTIHRTLIYKIQIKALLNQNPQIINSMDFFIKLNSLTIEIIYINCIFFNKKK